MKGLSKITNFKFIKWITGSGESTFQLNSDDIVVFVVGLTGSGKSTFVDAVMQGLVEVGQSPQPTTGVTQVSVEVGQSPQSTTGVTPVSVEVGHHLRPTTEKVLAIRCELTDEARNALGAKGLKNIVFVDTPCFLADSDKTEKVVQETKAWLEKSKLRSTRLGTIYMLRIEIDPTENKECSIQNYLDTFARTFSPEPLEKAAFPQRLHCVFSCVDHVGAEKIVDHWKKFQEQLGSLRKGTKLKWDTSTHPSLFVKGDPGTAWNAVEKLFSSPPPPPPPSPPLPPPPSE